MNILFLKNIKGKQCLGSANEIMTKTVRRPSKRKGGEDGSGGVGATPKEMARAKHIITNNKEERAKQRTRCHSTPCTAHYSVVYTGWQRK